MAGAAAGGPAAVRAAGRGHRAGRGASARRAGARPARGQAGGACPQPRPVGHGRGRRPDPGPFRGGDLAEPRHAAPGADRGLLVAAPAHHAAAVYRQRRRLAQEGVPPADAERGVAVIERSLTAGRRTTGSGSSLPARNCRSLAIRPWAPATPGSRRAGSRPARGVRPGMWSRAWFQSARLQRDWPSPPRRCSAGPVEDAARRTHRRRARPQPGRHRRPGLGGQRAGLGGRAAAQRGGGARAPARRGRPGHRGGRPVPAWLARGPRGRAFTPAAARPWRTRSPAA